MTKAANFISIFFVNPGQQPDAPGENPAGEQPGGGLRQRLHGHQRELQPLWQIPGDEVHGWRDGGGGEDLRVPAGEVQSHSPGSVNVSHCDMLGFLSQTGARAKYIQQIISCFN